MEGEGAYDVEFLVVWPDQSVHWLWSKGRFYFEDSALSRVAGIVVDISDRKETVEALRVAKNHLQATLNAIPDFVFEVDAQPNPEVPRPQQRFAGRTSRGFHGQEICGCLACGRITNLHECH
jgi:PAS domain-containing protein